MNKITTIIFDAGGVLFDTKISREQRITNLLRSKGFISEDISNALLIGESFYKKLPEYKWLSKWEDEEEFFNQYYEIIANILPTNDKYSLQKQLFHHTHYAVNCILFSEVKDVLESFYGYYKLGVISNAFPSMGWIFDLLDIRKYFNEIILSSEVGKAKPDFGIYNTALEILNVEASECVFIDDKQINIDAATSLGLTGIYLDRKINDLNIIKSYLK